LYLRRETSKYLKGISDIQKLFEDGFGEDFYFRKGFVTIAHTEVSRLEEEFKKTLKEKGYDFDVNNFFSSIELFERDKIVYSYYEFEDFIEENYDEYHQVSKGMVDHLSFKNYFSKVEQFMDYIDDNYFNSKMYKKRYSSKQMAFKSGLIPDFLDTEDKVTAFFKMSLWTDEMGNEIKTLPPHNLIKNN
jgi:hypothetical protein